RVRHVRHRAVEGERAETTLPARYLLDRTAVDRNAKEMRGSTYTTGEIDEASVGAPPLSCRDIVPRAREHSFWSAARWNQHEIDRTAVMKLLGDDGIGRHLPRCENPFSVGR